MTERNHNNNEIRDRQNTRAEQLGEDKLIVTFSCRALAHDGSLAPAFQEVVVCFGRGVKVAPVLEKIHKTQPLVLPQVSESLQRRNVLDKQIETTVLRRARRQIRRVTNQNEE